MTRRDGDAVDTGAGTRIPTTTATSTGTASTGSGAGSTEPLINRFPSIAFTYDTDASRLVMQYRDPANGKTVSQIPTEAALKQYKEAQAQEKDAERASLLKLTVGGDAQTATDGHAGGGSGAAASRVSGLVSQADGGAPAVGTTTTHATTHAASVAVAASAGSAAVAHFSTTTARPAGASVARVNVVI